MYSSRQSNNPYSSSILSFSSPNLGYTSASSPTFPDYGLGLSFDTRHLVSPSSPANKSAFSRLLTSLSWGKKKPTVEKGSKVVSKATPIRPGIVVSPPLPDRTFRDSLRYEFESSSPPPQQPKEAGTRLKHQRSLGALSLKLSIKRDRPPSALPVKRSEDIPPMPRSAPPSKTTLGSIANPDAVPASPVHRPISTSSHTLPRVPIPALTLSQSESDQSIYSSPSTADLGSFAGLAYLLSSNRVEDTVKSPMVEALLSDEDETLYWRKPSVDTEEVRSSEDTWGEPSQRFALPGTCHTPPPRTYRAQSNLAPQPRTGLPFPKPADASPPFNPAFERAARGRNARGSITEEEDAAAGDLDEDTPSRSFFGMRRGTTGVVSGAGANGSRKQPTTPVARGQPNLTVGDANGSPIRLPSFRFSTDGMSMEEVFADLEERMGITAEEALATLSAETYPGFGSIRPSESSVSVASSANSQARRVMAGDFSQTRQRSFTTEVQRPKMQARRVAAPITISSAICSSSSAGSMASTLGVVSPRPPRVQSLHNSIHRSNQLVKPPPAMPEVFVFPPTPIFTSDEPRFAGPQEPVSPSSSYGGDDFSDRSRPSTPPLSPSGSANSLHHSNSADSSLVSASTSATSIRTIVSVSSCDDAFSNMLQHLNRPRTPPVDEEEDCCTPTLDGRQAKAFSVYQDSALTMVKAAAIAVGDLTTRDDGAVPRWSVYGGAAWEDGDDEDDYIANMGSQPVPKSSQRISCIGSTAKPVVISEPDNLVGRHSGTPASVHFSSSVSSGSRGSWRDTTSTFDHQAYEHDAASTAQLRAEEDVIAALLKRRSAVVSGRFDDVEDDQGWSDVEGEEEEGQVTFGERVVGCGQEYVVGMAM